MVSLLSSLWFALRVLLLFALREFALFFLLRCLLVFCVAVDLHGCVSVSCCFSSVCRTVVLIFAVVASIPDGRFDPTLDWRARWTWSSIGPCAGLGTSLNFLGFLGSLMVLCE